MATYLVYLLFLILVQLKVRIREAIYTFFKIKWILRSQKKATFTAIFYRRLAPQRMIRYKENII